MKMTSSLSSTMIGHGKSDHERHEAVNRTFREESNSILKRLENHHPSHRHKIMQVQYPDTIKRLCGQAGGGGRNGHQTQTQTIAPPTDRATPAQTRRVMRESEFRERNTRNLTAEYGMNNRKMHFNRGSASEAVVSNIMSGKGPPVVDPVFPQRATHHQCLALTNRLAMPDAHRMPPEVPRGKKWLGDDRGWE